MAMHELSPGEGLYYEHAAPRSEGGVTFVFFNALTGSTAMWNAAIVPALQAAGYGTLVYNLRGQEDSPFKPGTRLELGLIVSDALDLLARLEPSRPVFVGLSIGGLFAARTWLEGGAAEALVLVNTLRKDSARLRWINDAVLRAVESGGRELLGDLYNPMLFGEPWLAANRRNFLSAAPYTPMDKASGHYNLLDHSRGADWNLPYERLTLPVLVVSGLRDRVFFDAAAVDELCGRMPDARRVDLPDAGHLIPAEKPDPLTQALTDLAQRLG